MGSGATGSWSSRTRTATSSTSPIRPKTEIQTEALLKRGAVAAKKRTSVTTHKKVVVLMLDGSRAQGYLNASDLGQQESVEILTSEGEYQTVELSKVKSVHFVREFRDDFEPERKAFLSRPKLDGLWVRLRFRDDDVQEGIVAND